MSKIILNIYILVTRPRRSPRAYHASIIVIPLTGIDLDRYMPFSATLLQLEDNGTEKYYRVN